MNKPAEIAIQIMRFAADEVEPDYLSQLRLHKLLYYAQGWSLAKRGRRLYDADIQAWTHGPVVASLYPMFAEYKGKPITEIPTKAVAVEAGDKFFARVVWEHYKRYSASRLWEKTHSERPWVEARYGLAATEKSDRVIPDETMQQYFLHESTDRLDYDFVKVPEWRTQSDEKFLDAAQSAMIRFAPVFRRLA